MEAVKIDKALEELRKAKERKFDETIELIVNLKKFDIKKNSINTFVSLPHKVRDKKVCGFIDGKISIIDTIPKSQFPAYKDKKKVKKLVKNYDFFISSPVNMPAVATTFGRVLGPAGKMPSPKLGIIPGDNDDQVKGLVDRIEKTVRVQTKEPSIKVPIGRLSMSDKDVIENATTFFHSILNELPNNKENVKSILIKSTMGKPHRINID